MVWQPFDKVVLLGGCYLEFNIAIIRARAITIMPMITRVVCARIYRFNISTSDIVPLKFFLQVVSQNKMSTIQVFQNECKSYEVKKTVQERERDAATPAIYFLELHFLKLCSSAVTKISEIQLYLHYSKTFGQLYQRLLIRGRKGISC